MNDAFLRRSHYGWLRRLECGECRIAVTALDRVFDFAHRVSQQRAPRLVHFRSAGDDARGFAGRLCVGHQSLIRSSRLRRIPAKAIRLQQVKAAKSFAAKGEAYSEAVR